MNSSSYCPNYSLIIRGLENLIRLKVETDFFSKHLLKLFLDILKYSNNTL